MNLQPRQHIKKHRHYFANKGPSSQSYVFPVVMYRCESWTIKKAEHWRIDAFEVWCWKRLLRVPWTARKSNQSILKEIRPEYSLEGLILKLKLQYFGHLMWRTDSLEKTMMLGKIEGRRRRGRQKIRRMVGWHQRLNGHEFEQGPGVGDGQGSLVCCSPWGCRVRHDWETKLTDSLISSVQEMQLLQILTQTVIFIHFYFNHFSHCVLISHCIFILKIFKSIDTWYYFIYLDFVLII